MLLSMPEDHEIFRALLRAVHKPAGFPDDPGELLLSVAAFFLGTPFVGALEYAWIGILLVVGGILIVSAVTSK